jgi:hypothetical protein
VREWRGVCEGEGGQFVDMSTEGDQFVKFIETFFNLQPSFP